VVRAQYHLDLVDILDELIYQRSIDDYKTSQQSAYLAAAFNRSMGGKAEMKDMIGEPPKRQREIDDGLKKARAAAKAKGVKVPDERG
jgi:hypothetical protein